MPNITTQPLNVTKVTSDSITITWERWAGCTANPDPIIYKVGITANDNPWPGNYWKTVKEGKGFYTYTFTGLKPETEYVFNVKAFDESGQVCQYPLVNGSMTAKTPAPDKEPPTVSSLEFKNVKVTYNSIHVEWEPAKDNITPASKIKYQVYFMPNRPNEPHHMISEGTNITSYTFKNLQPDTEYLVHVFASDEAGNFIRYPAQNASQRIKTAKPDTEKPTVTSSAFKNIRTTANSIYVEWEAAKDNVTPANKIRYKLYFKEDVSTESLRLIKDDTGYYSYTFTGLKDKTDYLVRVVGYDEAGNNVQYPAQNAAFRIKTGNPDKEKPTASDTAFKNIRVSTSTIHVEWVPATDNVTKASDIVYKIYIQQSGSTAGLSLVKQGKKLYAHTFSGLKKDTEYYVQVCAVDESGNVLQYPAKNAAYRIKTAAVDDNQAPTVTSRAFKVSNIQDDRFTIQWEKANDKVTPANKILYKVNLTEYLNPNDPWRTVKEAKGISSHTFTGLKANTRYSFCVKAYDEAGNLLQYPADNSSESVLTKPKMAHQLSFSIEQGATVLMGTNTISFAIEYTYVQLNSIGNVIGRGTGSWEYKWSNKKKTSGVITLPENCYFEDNQVFVRIRSRRAASAGLNTWKTCSSGYVDVGTGNLKFKLTGSYYSYSVRLGGSAADGYAQFK